MSKTMKATTQDLADLYEQYKTHSGVFRALAADPSFQHPDGKPNYFRISKYTNKRVQHVRNVLITPLSPRK
jgi:hypothetical protein